MKISHSTLNSALLSVESLVSQGHTSFKLYRQDSQWYVIVNGESK